MKTVGFDFGTTNSLISVVAGDRVISFSDDEGRPTPSVIAYEGSAITVGRKAREKLSEPGLGVHGSIVRSPKTLIGKESVLVEGVRRSPVDIVRDVVEYIREQARSSSKVQGLRAERAVVTIPINMHGERRACLRDAFRAAGISIVQFVHEPLAALYGHLRDVEDLGKAARRLEGQLIIVLDWGGGTLDLTLCRLTDGMLVQIANDGTDELGGDHFDAALKKEVEQRYRKENNVPDDVSVQIEAPRHLLHRCELAKIDLSSRARAQIFVPNFFDGLDDTDLAILLDQETLEEIVRPLLDSGLKRVEELLAREGYSPASVSLCLATGGMANMPAIMSRLRELFGPKYVEVPDRSASVISEGAAWIAHDNATLLLAKNLELTLARGSRMTLLHAGLVMPFEGEERSEQFVLYCADPQDGFARFELVSPSKPGMSVYRGDPRRVLTHFQIKVDALARPFAERLHLDVKIDENLILRTHARPSNFEDMEVEEVHDLEFALSLPITEPNPRSFAVPKEKPRKDSQHRRGAVVIRSNLASRSDDWSVVPGEVLHEFNSQPANIYWRKELSDIQRTEHLYYQDCSGCGRRSNDSACTCGTTYPGL